VLLVNFQFKRNLEEKFKAAGLKKETPKSVPQSAISFKSYDLTVCHFIEELFCTIAKHNLFKDRLLSVEKTLVGILRSEFKVFLSEQGKPRTLDYFGDIYSFDRLSKKLTTGQAPESLFLLDFDISEKVGGR